MKSIKYLAALALLIGLAGQAAVAADAQVAVASTQVITAPAQVRGLPVRETVAADAENSSATSTAMAERASFPVSAAAEPPGWLLLLCGLVVAGFMAFRKASLLS